MFTAPPFKNLVHQSLQDTAVVFYDGFQYTLRLWCRHRRLWKEAVRKVMRFNRDWPKCAFLLINMYISSQNVNLKNKAII